MPVFLFENDWDKWMTGSFDDLLALQAREVPNDLIEMERTPELWVRRKTEAAGQTPRVTKPSL